MKEVTLVEFCARNKLSIVLKPREACWEAWLCVNEPLHPKIIVPWIEKQNGERHIVSVVSKGSDPLDALEGVVQLISDCRLSGLVNGLHSKQTPKVVIG